MKFILCFWLGLAIPGFGQMLTPLRRELDSMYVLDQRNRLLLARLAGSRVLSDSLSAVYKTDRIRLTSLLWAEQASIDSSNLRRVDALLKQYGYPGKTLVGTPANEIAFQLIQRSHQTDVFLPALKKAAEAGELPFQHYALMLDKSLMRAGKPQVYGSQVSCKPIRASNELRCFVWPIADYRTVNERRKQAGFSMTVAENAIRLRAAYDPSLTVDLMRKLYMFD